MKVSKFLRISAVFMAAVVLFAGCASSTMINSVPSGAKVYINGESVGTTPYLYTDTKVLGSVVNVDLVKDGYETLYTSFTRTEQVNAGAIVGGFFLLFPFLWTMEYKPTHNYELIPLPATGDTITTEVPGPVQVKSPTERLKELKKLLDDKLITEKEYETRKKAILEEL
jgi:hypothetical protein